MLALGGLAIVASIAHGAEEKKPQPITVAKIVKVSFTREKKLPANLLITATGEVPTGGYRDVQLIPYTYVKQPDDGIQDFTLQATPPAGPVIQVISQVSATYRYDGEPGRLKGVRIHGDGAGTLVKLLK